MVKYYFTFGSAKQFPFQNTYLVVAAKDVHDAVNGFRKKHPDVNEGCLNCSDYYSEMEWKDFVEQHYESQKPAEVIFTENCFGKKPEGFEEVSVYVPEHNQLLIISEGSGDNLLAEDRKEGYVDYVNYETYFLESGMPESEGGMLMYKQLVQEKFACLADSIPDVLKEAYGCAYVNCKILSQDDELN